MIGAEVLRVPIVMEEISTAGVGREEAVPRAHGEEDKRIEAAENGIRYHSQATDQVSRGYGVNKVLTERVTWSTLGWKALLMAA